MAERQRFPKCGLCGHHHAGVAHIWDKANSPTIAEVRAATSGLERVFPSPKSNPKPAAPTIARSVSNEGGASRLSAKPPKAAPPKFPRKRGKAGPVDSTGEPDRLTQHPRGAGAGRDKTMTKKIIVDALNAGKISPLDAAQAALTIPARRGRKPGKVPFDKKAYDRERSAARRAAKKAPPQEPTNAK